MGLILDSSAVVAAEREGQNAKRLLQTIALETGDSDLAISVITVLELSHGVARANTAEREMRRRQFLQELMTAVPIYPVTAAIALRAGRIDGQSQAQGVRIPLSDLLIGVTALELGYQVVTHNVRHFKLIPVLALIEL